MAATTRRKQPTITKKTEKKLSVARKGVLQKFHTATANVENLAIFKRSVVDQF